MEVLFQYLNEIVRLFADVERVHRVTFPGWTRVGSALHYVTPQGCLTGRVDQQICSENGQIFPETVPLSGHLLMDVADHLISLTPQSSASPVLALYVTASFLHHLFRQAAFGPKFVVFLHGPRGSLKTSLALAVTQIQRRDSPEFTLKSTAAGLEAGFRKFRDAVMLIDDLAPTPETRAATEMRHNLELVVRAFGDGTGKKRNLDFARSDLEQYESSGGAVITGEYVAGCESSLARCLLLPLNAGDVDPERLRLFQDDETLLSGFIAALLRFAAENADSLVTLIRDQGKHIRSQCLGRYVNARYGEYRAQLFVSAEILLRFLEAQAQPGAERLTLMRERLLHSIEDAIECNNRALIEASPTVLLCKALLEELGSERFQIRPLGEKLGRKEELILDSEEVFYLQQRHLPKIWNSYAQSNEVTVPKHSATSLAALLHQAGVIEQYEEGGTARYSHKIPGYGDLRFMEIKKKKLREVSRDG